MLFQQVVQQQLLLHLVMGLELLFQQVVQQELLRLHLAMGSELLSQLGWVLGWVMGLVLLLAKARVMLSQQE